jgi:hypothetical protein
VYSIADQNLQIGSKNLLLFLTKPRTSSQYKFETEAFVHLLFIPELGPIDHEASLRAKEKYGHSPYFHRKRAIKHLIIFRQEQQEFIPVETPIIKHIYL